MDGNELNYLCCFCHTRITSSNTDPADINVLINIDKPKHHQYSQFFYCHIECFRNTLHEKIKYHFHLHNITD